MDTRSMEQRVEFLEAQHMAHGVALRIVIGEALRKNEVKLAGYREMASAAVDALYGEKGIRPHAHPILQMALHEIEQLFESFGPKGAAGSPRPDQP